MSNNAALQDFDALMDATMDDIEDLPPIGVPPSGSYDLIVTASRETPKAGGNNYIKLSYEIIAVNELKDGSEAAEVKSGQKFSEMFSPFKKDGTPNEIGMGTLKERLKPFATHFGTSKISDIITSIQQTNLTAVLVRTADRQNEGTYRFRLKDVVVV